MRNFRLQAMIEAAIFGALALILDMFVPSIKLSPAISISFAMVPIFIVAFRWGFKISFLSGLIWGLLQLIFDPWIVHPVQAIMEYVIAFPFIAFAGLFSSIIQRQLKDNKKINALIFIVFAIFVGSLTRYFWHFLSGFIFIEYFAPEVLNPVWYSFIGNGTSMLGAFISCSIVMILLILASPRFFILKKDY
ncbi:energy-coupled thiamine transporter ThiT [Fredinandcohnia quinoae]|uniref:Energy-coupled thiamine transporter ThiT n=1 Tax=Fredinandcohnia quinoae TaxID=2918902 RepID=A0AAW5EA50_9BACI|nr:energy-coupled thiamine transporter ThiT [Fredinandcohnia sp. SECRCQ15]MCH1626767.1 energy-coupled thiamine transporter ThiT [Fredinandcohnia sp. SECRCQ15]